MSKLTMNLHTQPRGARATKQQAAKKGNQIKVQKKQQSKQKAKQGKDKKERLRKRKANAAAPKEETIQEKLERFERENEERPTKRRKTSDDEHLDTTEGLEYQEFGGVLSFVENLESNLQDQYFFFFF